MDNQVKTTEKQTKIVKGTKKGGPVREQCRPVYGL